MRGGIMYDQKDIVLIHFPFTDFSYTKQRPALIISNTNLNKTEDRICCLITTNPHKDNILIKKDFFKEGSLPFKSYIKPYRIFTIHEKVIIKKLCSLNDNSYRLILKKINEYIE